MRILLVLLAIAVAVYVVVRVIQRGGSREVAPPERRPAPGSPRAAAEFQRQVRERAEQQRRGLPATPVPEPQIEIDADVFAHDDPWGAANETFVVVSDADGTAVRTALEQAANRFLLVDETGVEHPDHESSVAAFNQGLYTPNYVSAPETTGQGHRVYVDCKGVVSPDMARTFRRILREELGALGTGARVSTASFD